MDGLLLNSGIVGIQTPITTGGDTNANPTTVSAAAVARATVTGPQKQSRWSFSFKYPPLRSLWPGTKSRYDAVSLKERSVSVEENAVEEKIENHPYDDVSAAGDENWVSKILHVRSLWRSNDVVRDDLFDETKDVVESERFEEECDGCEVSYDDDDDKVEFDADKFSKLLKKVTLDEARLYGRMSYLSRLAYSISEIKPGILLKKYGLRFVASSLEMKAQQALKREKEKVSDKIGDAEDQKKEVEAEKEEISSGNQISASTAYQIAAAAASYLHSHTKKILPFKHSLDTASEYSGHGDNINLTNADIASFVATTDSVTAVVAANEEVKQAVADDLNSTVSSPCEWFICDDDQSCTRYFVIQGSESLASWQANLLFEPVQFEGLDINVHRGVYEAAKGIYEQMLPEVRAHQRKHGGRAAFRFTGHSLGGSLSLLVNLILLIRGEVPRASLLPIITFGAPSVMCGGDRLLRMLGLPRSHLQAITMHRDIVPRAFSCNYPNRVAGLLMAVNGKFRNHPCLNNQSLLYAPMGEFLILQPDDKHSPNHDLLPSGSGLYLLTPPVPDANESEKQIRAAKSVFLNSPHPLEILKDRSAYGSGGTIQRDHDMNSYLKSVRSVIRQELTCIRKARREHRRRLWWPLLGPSGINAGLIVGRPQMASGRYVSFSGVFQNGRESLKRFTRLVASQHMHLLVVLLLPARTMILEACSVIRLP